MEAVAREAARRSVDDLPTAASRCSWDTRLIPLVVMLALWVTDVVTAPGTDPRGSVLGASFLPPAIAGVLPGSAVTLLRPRGGRAALTLTGVTVTAGLGARRRSPPAGSA
ncbi:hypothetical protein ACVWZD_007058 [Streptomyces sp. TE3672]